MRQHGSMRGGQDARRSGVHQVVGPMGWRGRATSAVVGCLILLSAYVLIVLPPRQVLLGWLAATLGGLALLLPLITPRFTLTGSVLVRTWPTRVRCDLDRLASVQVSPMVSQGRTAGTVLQLTDLDGGRVMLRTPGGDATDPLVMAVARLLGDVGAELTDVERDRLAAVAGARAVGSTVGYRGVAIAFVVLVVLSGGFGETTYLDWVLHHDGVPSSAVVTSDSTHSTARGAQTSYVCLALAQDAASGAEGSSPATRCIDLGGVADLPVGDVVEVRVDAADPGRVAIEGLHPRDLGGFLLVSAGAIAAGAFVRTLRRRRRQNREAVRRPRTGA